MSKQSIGLTQFIDFTIKGSSAKTTMVRKIKYQQEYNPAFDYWKALRDGIRKFHEQNHDIIFFDGLINELDPKKRENYISSIKQYLKFIKGKDIEWFDPGKAIWTSNELVVRSSPELGLIINGQPHLIKLYFKGKTERIDKRNISTTITLMNTSTFEKKVHVTEAHRSVLNIHKNRLHSDTTVDTDRLLALQSEAAQFMYIWENI